MKQDSELEALIAKCKTECPKGLETAILKRLHVLARRSLFARLALEATLSVASFAGTVTTFYYLGRSLARSGFSEYFYLLLSDTSIFFDYWKEIGFSLLESLPLLSLMTLLLLLGVFIWASGKTVSSVRDMRAA